MSVHEATEKMVATPTSQVNFVLVGLCTYHRLSTLERAIKSVLDLDIPQGVRLELVVVDNSKEASAYDLVRHIDEASEMVISYCHQPRRGIPLARNMVLDFALSLGSVDEQPQWIAFFDDDESLDPQWLVNYLNYLRYYHPLRENAVSEVALVLTGPVQFMLSESAPEWSRKANVFKPLQFPSGTRRRWAATNNVFFDIAIAREQRLRFDSSLSLSSGDDPLFFMQAARRGAKILWVNEATAQEMVERERTTYEWVIRRNYSHGSNGPLVYSKLFPSERIKPIVLSLCKGTLYLCSGLLLMITLGTFTWILPQFRHHTINALALISRGLGWLCGIWGFRYREYAS